MRRARPDEIDQARKRNKTDTRPASDLTSPELSPRCPCRPHRWRWERAGFLNEGARRERWEDTWVRRAHRYRQALNAPTQSSSDPTLQAAEAIARGEPRRRCEIESRILAGQSDDVIALRFGLTPEVVATYETLFFAVRERLLQRDWIATVAIHAGACSDIERFLRRYAYFGGPLVLNAVIVQHDAEQAGMAEADDSTIGRLTRLARLVDSIKASSMTASSTLR